MVRIRENCDDFIMRKHEEFKKHKLKRKPIEIKDIGGRAKHFFYREGWAFIEQQNNPRKVFTIEKLRFQRVEGRAARQHHRKTGRIEYRIGYYINMAP